MTRKGSAPRAARRLWGALLLIAFLALPACAAPWIQFSGTATRVTFRPARAVTKWQVQLLVPRAIGHPRGNRVQPSSVVRLTDTSAHRTLDYIVKSAYATSSMAVYLARLDGHALTLVLPEIPRVTRGSSARTRAVLLFDDDPVSTPCEGTWSVQPLPQR